MLGAQWGLLGLFKASRSFLPFYTTYSILRPAAPSVGQRCNRIKKRARLRPKIGSVAMRPRAIRGPIQAVRAGWYSFLRARGREQLLTTVRGARGLF
jgi:hypothetical protein